MTESSLAAITRFIDAERQQLADWLTDHADVLTSPPSSVGLMLDGAPECPCGLFWCSCPETDEQKRYDAWWRREFESGRYDFVEVD